MAADFQAPNGGVTDKQSDSGGAASPLAAPSISLPKGGGAIKGIGEKFAANPVTGTGSMSVPIFASPGRSGFGPQLALSYDSGAGNGTFGFGWNLPLPSITRKTDKGVPQYRDDEESDIFILSGAEDLVPVLLDDGSRYRRDDIVPGYRIDRYRPRIEGLFARIERWTHLITGDVHWRSISRDNVTTVYGADSERRVYDPAEAESEHPKRIFSWLISHSHDDKGNTVVYEYKPEDSLEVEASKLHERNRNRSEKARTANRYLKRILYGNRTPVRSAEDLARNGWLFELVFDYGEHDQERPGPADDTRPWPARQDPFSSYRSGFEIRTYRLCQRVLMFHHFPAEPANPHAGYDGLVRSTDFTYSYEENKDDVRNPIYSFLKSVTQTGYKLRDDGTYLSKSLPPVEFHYSEPRVSSEVRTVDAASLENLPYGIDGAGFQWLDLDGEGLAGVLAEQGDGWYYKHNLSAKNVDPRKEETTVKVELGALELVAQKPSPASTTRGLTQFLDLAGDGCLDVVSLRPEAPGFYERTDDERWAPFRTFESLPRLDWADPNLRFVDLTGDGHADILITEDQALVWHRSLAEAGFGTAQRTLQALDEEQGPRLVFADGTQSIYLADMSGDGLTDLVRIRNGEVSYWPNLGYGRFGAKVAMDNAPWFDAPDQFDQGRVRVADIDGTGTTDILYLGRDGVRIFFNQSGNAWGQPTRLPDVPLPDPTQAVTVIDLLGNGTACLVWSSPLPADSGRQMRYVDLMGGQKPHLLTQTQNNLGAETHVHYVPSTRFYVEDKLAGRAWVTRLPFPVHVVERVETYDHISRNRFVSRYAYHHGYFDGIEREFRGFGMVEQWDTESYAALAQTGGLPVGDNVDAASHVPPVHTRTWYHTGIYLGRNRVSQFFSGLLDAQDKGEYYREPGLSDDQARDLLLEDTVLPDGLTVDEEREACRALKGTMLRQEVYADDDVPGASAAQKERARTPYTVAEQNFSVRLEQPRGGNRHAVFFTHPREAITYHYERRPADPRIQHALTLEVDRYGNVLKAAAIGYGRRQTDASLPTEDDQTKQRLVHITCTENTVTKALDQDADHYRTPLPAETRTYELRKPQQEESGPGMAQFHRFDDVLAYVQQSGDGLHEIVYEDIDFERARQAAARDPTEGQRYFRRLIEHVRTLYRRDNLTALLPLREVQALALPGEAYKLAFTPGLLAQVFQRPRDQRPREGQVPESLLPNPAEVLGVDAASLLTSDRGGYVDLDADGHWWIPSGRVFFDAGADIANPAATAGAELAAAREHFFLPAKFADPFGNSAVAQYDDFNLLVTQTQDALGNRVTAEHDNRLLQPWRVTDPNGNRAEVAFDVLGLVAGTAVRGKANPDLAQVEGDSLDGFDPDPPQAQIDAFFDTADPHPVAPDLLAGATTRILYDVDRFRRSRDANPADPDQWQPTFAASLARETHVSDLEPGQGTKIQISFGYSDGFGREIQKKIQAEPEKVDGVAGPPRWVGSGWTIFNNKGKPVRQYEPFFSHRHQFEFDARVGVSPVLFYDPAGRVVATLYPNDTYAKVTFDPWQQSTWDANDTVLSDPRTDPDISAYVAEYFEAVATKRVEDGREPWQTWHQQRIGGANGQHERRAAEKAAAHADTPTVLHADALGRTFLTVAHNKVLCPGHKLDGTDDKFRTRIDLDIEGNQRAVLDERRLNDTRGLPLGELEQRVVMHYDHDMLGTRIHQASMEAGERWVLNDVTGKPIRAWDSRGHAFRTEYDALRRPLRSFVIGADVKEPSRTFLVERLLYGERHPEAAALNLRGVLFQHFDQAGVATTEARDFKGNPLSSSRRLARDYKQTVDWGAVDEALARDATGAPLDLDALESAATPLLEAETFTGHTTYDALNRPVAMTTPHTPAMRPSVIRPGYNEANLLERVDAVLRGAQVNGQPDWTAFVTNIDYDAKGQRQRIDYGNGASTLYEYDPQTFRLIHLLTRRNAIVYPDDCPQPPRAGWPGCQVQNLRYTYDPVGNITHIQDDAQQRIFFLNERVEPSNDYTYDAIYRLIEATGREHLGQGGVPLPHSHDDKGRVGLVGIPRYAPGDPTAMATYVESYVYDAVGNILAMKHRGSQPANAGWTRHYAYEEASLFDPAKTSNRLSSTTLDGADPLTEPYLHDEHGNMRRMAHLANHPNPDASNMHWDYRDQLWQVDLRGDGTAAWYVYDAAGQRTRKVCQKSVGLIEERIYLGGFELFRVRNGPGEITLERETMHIIDGSRRIALVETRTLGDDPAPEQLTRFQFGDHRGSTSLELDRKSDIVAYEEYTPYGSTSYQALWGGTETPKRYRHTAKERDSESGLQYFGARYCSPWIGRWISCDPIGARGARNPFVYCEDNPVILTDPDGADWEFCVPYYDEGCSFSSTAEVVEEEVQAAGAEVAKAARTVARDPGGAVIGAMVGVEDALTCGYYSSWFLPNVLGEETMTDLAQVSEAYEGTRRTSELIGAVAITATGVGGAISAGRAAAAAPALVRAGAPVAAAAVDLAAVGYAGESALAAGYVAYSGARAVRGSARDPASSPRTPSSAGSQRARPAGGGASSGRSPRATARAQTGATDRASPSGSSTTRTLPRTNAPRTTGTSSEPSRIGTHRSAPSRRVELGAQGTQSHHAESQTALRRYIANYKPKRDITILMEPVPHSATFAPQAAQRARGAAFVNELGSPAALQEAVEIMVGAGESLATAGQVVMEHIGYLFSTTPLSRVWRSLR